MLLKVQSSPSIQCNVYAGKERKEGIIYLMMHTFYLWLYGIGHMVKDHHIGRKPAATTTWGTIFQ